MRGGPKSSSRRTWRWFSTLAALALAGACGGSPTTGIRPGSGGSGAGSGGSGAGTGSGGSGATGSGGSGALTDGGPVDQLPPFDGGVCSDNQGIDPGVSAASGTFSGAATGTVCTGGATASVSSTPAEDGGAPLVALFIDNINTGDPAARIRFQDPASATDGVLNIYIGLPAASPGTYAQDVTCGSAVLLADLAPPDPSICTTDASYGYGCPTGCQATGPIFDVVCTPIAPQVTYAATAASDCHYATSAAGSWTVTLTSLTSEPDAGTGIEGATTYKVHGTLTATLAAQDPDAGTASVTISLSF